MVMQSAGDQLTPREYEQYNQQKEMWELQRAHAVEMKQLEIEVMKLEAKWRAWLKLPVVIITLPIRFLFGIAYIVAVARKTELGDNFWTYMLKW